MIIAIDGPAGSGKSTTARETARRLGFHHLDSGALYRALTLAALEQNIPPGEWSELEARDFDALGVETHSGEAGIRMHVGGRDVSDAIRGPEVNAHVSDLARVPAVRQWLLGRLRAIGRETDIVVDGRDIGTVVFPDAELKIFLTADPRVRARRRLKERGIEAPSDALLDAEADRLLERDRKDSQRAVAPLKQAADAVELDSTNLDFDGQVRRVVALARERMS